MELVYHDFQSGFSPMWKKLLELFGEERGIATRYVVVPQPTYEKGLAENFTSDTPPVVMKVRHGLFQKYDFLQELCEPLDDLPVAKDVISTYCTFNKDGKIIGLPYNSESAGIIYNRHIMELYFALPDRGNTDLHSVADIRDRPSFIAVADDMQKHCSELDIDGVFPCAAFAPNEDFQWRKFLLSPVIAHEIQEKHTHQLKDFDFSLSNSIRELCDMFFRDCAGKREDFINTPLSDSVGAFLHGRAAMILHPQFLREVYVRQQHISEEEQARLVPAEDLLMMPLYTNDKPEQKGLICGAAWHHVVRKNASPEEKEAGKAYVDWLINSPKARAVFKKMEYVVPYYSFKADSAPSLPLYQQLFEQLRAETPKAVSLAHLYLPDLRGSSNINDFQFAFGRELLDYATGCIDWETVIAHFCEGWKTTFANEAETLKTLFK